MYGYSYRGLRGLGVANCPSPEQLAGVEDQTDPCQNPLASLSLSSPGSLAIQDAIGPIPSGAPAASGPCLGPSLPYAGWRDSLGMCQPSWLLVGAVLGGLVLLGMARK